MNLRSEMLLDAKLIMRDGFLRINPDAQLDKSGYATRWEHNLLPGINAGRVEADLAGKGGSELSKKFRAAHSSAALAINSFAFLRDTAQPFPIPGIGSFQVDGFEQRFPTGLGGKPPHLDLTVRYDDFLVAIESKCLEYFKPKAAVFVDSYVKNIRDERREGPWYAEMMRLREDHYHYQVLDAAQLIKHAFGLACAVKDKSVVLLYLFWEPDDAPYHSVCKEHRRELAEFAEAVTEGEPAFAFVSYQDLWAYWESLGPAWLRTRVELLQSRYCGRLGSYEGYARVNGRKTDAGFWDDSDFD